MSKKLGTALKKDKHIGRAVLIGVGTTVGAAIMIGAWLVLKSK